MNPEIPNLDSMSIAALDSFRINAPVDLASLPEATRENLLAYAKCKIAAMRCRETGQIAAALNFEKTCERIYDRLPNFARW